VVLASALAHGFNDRRLAQLKGLLGVPARTLLRRRQWWLTQFIVTPVWIAARATDPAHKAAIQPAAMLRDRNRTNRRLFRMA